MVSFVIGLHVFFTQKICFGELSLAVVYMHFLSCIVLNIILCIIVYVTISQVMDIYIISRFWLLQTALY